VSDQRLGFLLMAALQGVFWGWMTGLGILFGVLIATTLAVVVSCSGAGGADGGAL